MDDGPTCGDDYNAALEMRTTAGGAAGRELPRRGQGENPHPGQPVRLARAQVQTLKRALKGLPAAVDLSAAFESPQPAARACRGGAGQRTPRHRLIDPTPSRKCDLVTAMLVAQVIQSPYTFSVIVG